MSQLQIIDAVVALTAPVPLIPSSDRDGERDRVSCHISRSYYVPAANAAFGYLDDYLIADETGQFAMLSSTQASGA